ncbi:unnamed protein product [Sympodiomycopsis kandeliae]
MADEKSPEGQPYRRQTLLTQGAPRRRLPTLAEVLARRTLPPVDLYCYYLFLQREGSEDSLDFWLDVQQHENLCRAYFKDLRRSGKPLRQEWPDYWRQAKTRGSIYNRVNGVDEDESEATSDGQHMTAYEGATTTGQGYTNTRSGHDVDPSSRPTDEQSGYYGDAREVLSDSQQHNTNTNYNTTNPSSQRHQASSSDPTSLDERSGPRFPGDPDYPLEGATTEESHNQRRRTLLAKRASLAPTVIARSSAITKTDLVASAERIYARYLLPGSEKEIYLPPQLRIVSFPIGTDRPLDEGDPEQMKALARVPDMFHPQKEYVFRTMEADVFPRFLRAKAFGNLTPISALVRLSLGLLALWAALATGFSFIFLDVGRAKRCWVILPFAVVLLLILSHQYELDPILVVLNRSETTPFRMIQVREPYVKKLLIQRAIGMLFVTAILTAALCVLFIFVPGHRL